MRAAIAFAALAGSAIAAPSYGSGYGNPNPQGPVENVVVVVETVVKTVYVTEGYEIPSATSSSVYVAPPAPTTTTTAVAEASKPDNNYGYGYGYGYPVSSVPAYEPPAPAPAKPTPTPEAPAPTYAPAPSSAPAPSPAPAPPANAGYMGVVSEWRSKMGLPELKQSSKLEGTSMNTVQSAPGVMKHKLNSGVYGQVLAEGGADEFEHVYLGGWLCEVPNAPGLGDACKSASNGWNYEGQTGHYDILVNPQYTEIGCSNYDNIWCCDLSY